MGEVRQVHTETELAKGKSISQILKVGQQDVLNALGGFPRESRHCALLAANILKEAVKDYLASKNEPWKRAYERH
jgi:nitrogen fixation NifU-like protein